MVDTNTNALVLREEKRVLIARSFLNGLNRYVGLRKAVLEFREGDSDRIGHGKIRSIPEKWKRQLVNFYWNPLLPSFSTGYAAKKTPAQGRGFQGACPTIS
jgi:hypothetical protein